MSFAVSNQTKLLIAGLDAHNGICISQGYDTKDDESSKDASDLLLS